MEIKIPHECYKIVGRIKDWSDRFKSMIVINRARRLNEITKEELIKLAKSEAAKYKCF